MRKSTVVALVSALLMASTAVFAADHIASNTRKNETAAVTAVFAALEKAFNQSDAEGVEKLYASEGVMMAPDTPDVVGSAEIRKHHQRLFETLSFHLALKITEIQQVAPDWILARDHSTGTGKMKANGQNIPLDGHGLYVFQRVDGVWKIARLSFSSLNPPPVASK